MTVTSSSSRVRPIVRYFRESETAVAALVLLLPLVVLYEVGTWYWTFDPIDQTETRIVAFSLLRDSLAACGATARWVAPACVISLLLGLALVQREKWTMRIWTPIVMALESVILALPLLVVGMLVSRYIPLASGNLMSARDIGPSVVLAIGAGIYEELIFRLLAFSVLHFMLCDFIGLSHRVSLPVIVICSGVAFSLYHYWGTEAFAWQSFLFRTLAGLYFGGLYLTRGFGVTACSHASYDIVVLFMRIMPQ